jgi:hypothetical protein
MEELKEIFRAKIYKECGILVNDLSDVEKEIQLFVYEKVFPFIKDSEEFIGLTFDGIQIIFDEERDRWRRCMDDDLYDPKIKDVNIDEINNLFKGKEEFLKDLKEKHNIENFPKKLYGKAFMCLAMTVTDMVNKDEMYEYINVLDLFVLSNNGHNNIIYEMQ